MIVCAGTGAYRLGATNVLMAKTLNSVQSVLVRILIGSSPNERWIYWTKISIRRSGTVFCYEGVSGH
jgi:hypothetical protein